MFLSRLSTTACFTEIHLDSDLPDVTYAELSLLSSMHSSQHVIVVRKPVEPTEYAHIDFGRTVTLAPEAADGSSQAADVW